MATVSGSPDLAGSGAPPPGGGAQAVAAEEEEREVVRVRVKKCESFLPPEFRSFAVDPQITSLDVLQHILIRAFDLNGKTRWCPATTDDCPDREHNREPLREQESSGMKTPNSHKTRLNGLTETGRTPVVMARRPSVAPGQEPFLKPTLQTWIGLDSGLERDAGEE
ncbi:uncharacterized protein LOC135228908 isoform X1 [Loxodonta africana]|uniref:uncharacterized protein LOC135228908 isoform X1 n=1 Tax=Loxodonta africana TaxID=9785 RepID=UPI0030D43386